MSILGKVLLTGFVIAAIKSMENSMFVMNDEKLMPIIKS